MNLPTLVYRLVKGSALTAAEHDENLRKLRDFVNALAALFGVSLNADGTLKPGAVNATNVLADRIVTQAKMDWLFNFYGVTAGAADAYTLTISPDTGYTPGTGVLTSLVMFVKFHAANTGASTIDVNGAGAVAITKNGTDALVGGEIATNQIYCCVYDGAEFQILGSIADAAAALTLPLYSGTSALPAAGAVVTFPHGLGAIPANVQVCMVRTNAVASHGYSQNDEMLADGVQGSSNRQCFQISSDSTNVYVVREAGGGVVILSRVNGSYQDISADTANWCLKCYASTMVLA